MLTALRRGPAPLSAAAACLERAAPRWLHHETSSPVAQHFVFVLGEPGAGKSTQCSKLVKEFGFSHLSAGELLRTAIHDGSVPNSQTLASTIDGGGIVPAHVTVSLLQKAMQGLGQRVYLIDGFPRNAENLDTWMEQVKLTPDLVLILRAPEDALRERLLARGAGRSDDTAAAIDKRLETFRRETVPVLDRLMAEVKAEEHDASMGVDEVYKRIREPFLAMQGAQKVVHASTS